MSRKKKEESFKPSSKFKLDLGEKEKPNLGAKLRLSQGDIHNWRGLDHVRSDPVQAIADFSRAILLVPEEPSYYWHRAEAHLSVLDWDSALLDFRQHEILTTPSKKDSEPLGVVEVETRSKSIYVAHFRMGNIAFTWGQCLLDQQRYSEALHQFNIAQKCGLRHDSCLLRIALAKIGLGDIEDALEILYTLTDIKRSDPDLFILRAKLFEIQKNTDFANLDLRHAESLNPNHPDLLELKRYVMSVAVDLKNLASDHVLKRQLNSAIWFLNHAIELDPEDFRTRLKRGILLAEVENYDSALEDLIGVLSNSTDEERVTEIKNYVGSIYNRLGIRSYQNNEIEDAISKFSSALAYNRKEAVVLKNRSDCYVVGQEFERALDDLLEACKHIPNDSECHKRLGVVYRALGAQSIAQGKYMQAISELNRAIAYDPSLGDYFYERARASYFLEKIDDAQKDLSMAISLSPGHQAAHAMISLMMTVPPMHDLGPLHPRKALHKEDIYTMDGLETQQCSEKVRKALAKDAQGIFWASDELPLLSKAQGGPVLSRYERNNAMEPVLSHTVSPSRLKVHGPVVLHENTFTLDTSKLPQLFK